MQFKGVKSVNPLFLNSAFAERQYSALDSNTHAHKHTVNCNFYALHKQSR